MVETQLVEELSVSSSAPTNQHQGEHRQGKGWWESGAIIANHDGGDRIPFLCIFLRGEEVSHHITEDGGSTCRGDCIECQRHGEYSRRGHAGGVIGDGCEKSRVTAWKASTEVVGSRSIAIITAPGMGNERRRKLRRTMEPAEMKDSAGEQEKYRRRQLD